MKVVLGMGCDRDTPLDVIEAGISHFINEMNLTVDQIVGFASVDKKADEVAFLELSEKNDWPFTVYSAQELDVVQGIENPSDVAFKYVGTHSVAEAACLLKAGATKLLMSKQKFQLEDGGKNMTCAIAAIV